METSALFATQPAPEAVDLYRRWLGFLEEEFERHHSPERRSEIVRDQLYQLYLGHPHGGRPDLSLNSELPGNVLTFSLDPANATMEAGGYPEIDVERYAERKPLLWFWLMFDRSPVGLNEWLGLRLRAMLGRYLFAHMGKGVRIGRGVEIDFGYNLSIEDGAVIGEGVRLGDRGGIHIGPGAEIGAFARIDSGEEATVIGARARIARFAVVRAGQRLPDGAVVQG
jgi:acetyltransferase-like isoleucine patch superfamily enzyme